MLNNPYLMRLFWTIVEETQSQELLTLSDTALAATLMQQVSRQVLMSAEEVSRLYDYIGSKLLLIRDIADSRQSRTFVSAPENSSAACVPIPAIAHHPVFI